VALALSLLILVLFILVLLNLGLVGPGSPGKGGHLVSLNLSEEKKADQTKPSPRKVEVTQTTAAARPRPAPLQKPDSTPPPPPVPAPPGFIHLSHDDMAASDISKMPKVASGGGDSGTGAKGTGDGPGGAILYNARWYREPTDAELGPYLKGNAPMGAWAMIACRTVDHFHVEDCEEIEESPRGSGLGRGLRQAAWQFLVWPPRVDGKPMVGAWVRIRFDFTRRGSGGE
jgi:protein TonB